MAKKKKSKYNQSRSKRLKHVRNSTTPVPYQSPQKVCSY